MTRKSARKSYFSKVTWSTVKKWFKAKSHRANRKRLRQARDIQEHNDKPLRAEELDWS